jgi:hypothetical protein
VPKSVSAEELRERILSKIKENPEGVTTATLITEFFGNVKDEDEYRRGAQRVSFNLAVLKKAKLIKKYGGMLGVYKLLDGRPEPQVHDLPDAVVRRKYPRKNGAHANGNGVANGDLKSYIIRDIRAKLTELEAL